MSERHNDCHDLVCNASREYPRGARGVGCSCGYRDSMPAQYEELVRAVLRFSTSPREQWAHAAIVMLAEAHAEDSQTMDRLQERGEGDNRPTRQPEDKRGSWVRRMMRRLTVRGRGICKLL